MEVRFRNFRCFKDTGFLKLKKITLLVGENSSGKTSFLAGLNHISGLLAGEDVYLNTAPFELGSFADIFHTTGKKETERYFEYQSQIDNVRFKWVFEDDQGEPKASLFSVKSTRPEIAMEIDRNRKDVAIEMQLAQEQKDFLEKIGAKFTSSNKKENQSERFHFNNIDKLFPPERFSSSFNFRDIIWRIEREYLYIWPRHLNRKMFDKQMMPGHVDFDEIHSDISEKINVLTRFRNHFGRYGGIPKFLALAPLRTEPSRAYSFAQSDRKLTPDGRHIPDKLLKYSSSDPDGYRQLQESLQKFGKEAGLFKEIQIKKFERNSSFPFSIMVKTKQGKLSNIMDVGYGVSQILPVIVEIISSNVAQSFLLQQPEVHLHPRAQAAFASLVANLTKDRKQFVIETHSDFILERLKYEIEKGHIDSNEVGIIFFDTEGKDTEIHQIDLGEDGLPKDTPPSYCRFFLEELDRVWP